DLAVSGDGATLLLACFSEGLYRYGQDGRDRDRLRTAQPCRHVAQSYAGDRILAAGLNSELMLLNRDGEELALVTLENSITGLALDALGETACACLSDGAVMKWRIKRSL